MPYPTIPPNNGGSFTKIWHKDTYPFIDPATQSDHTGHYVFITGASKGVGRATALSFASAGAAGIALGARSDYGSLSSEILSAASKAGKAAPKILSLKLDVMKYEDIEAAAKEVEKEFGRLDILINNAGYLSPFESILDTPKEDYWRNYEINMRGVYWVTKAFLPLMLKGGEKTIVNLSSRGAMGLRHGGSGYQVTKMAVTKFTEYLMVEYGDQGLLAFSVHPCGALTELGAGMPKNFHAMLDDKVEIGSDTICFLTAKRREWLAGRFLNCNWDMPEFLSKEKEIVEGDKLVFRMAF